jgi:hypothetical protein
MKKNFTKYINSQALESALLDWIPWIISIVIISSVILLIQNTFDLIDGLLILSIITIVILIYVLLGRQKYLAITKIIKSLSRSWLTALIIMQCFSYFLHNQVQEYTLAGLVGRGLLGIYALFTLISLYWIHLTPKKT